jgi:hypothetical protein
MAMQFNVTEVQKIREADEGPVEAKAAGRNSS